MRERGGVIPYYVVKGGRGFWQPTKEMRALGAKSIPCGEDSDEARTKAMECNKAWLSRADVSEFVQMFKRTTPVQDPNERGFVYFIRSGEFIKVGFTKSPRKRLESLKTAHPGEFVSILVVEGQYRHEQALHQLLGRYRFSGEWFRAAIPVLNVMAACVRSGRVEIGTEVGTRSECSPDVHSEQNFQEGEVAP